MLTQQHYKEVKQVVKLCFDPKNTIVSRILLQKQQIAEAVSLMMHTIDLGPSNSSLFEETVQHHIKELGEYQISSKRNPEQEFIAKRKGVHSASSGVIC
jgi:hypothetical protein